MEVRLQAHREATRKLVSHHWKTPRDKICRLVRRRTAASSYQKVGTRINCWRPISFFLIANKNQKTPHHSTGRLVKALALILAVWIHQRWHSWAMRPAWWIRIARSFMKSASTRWRMRCPELMALNSSNNFKSTPLSRTSAKLMLPSNILSNRWNSLPTIADPWNYGSK